MWWDNWGRSRKLCFERWKVYHPKRSHGDFEPSEAAVSQTMAPFGFCRLRECFLVKWRKPYRFEIWPQPPQWKARLVRPNADFVCGRAPFPSIFPSHEPGIFFLDIHEIICGFWIISIPWDLKLRNLKFIYSFETWLVYTP